MEDVPIIITDRYQPSKKPYHLPQAVLNKLVLPTTIYEESPLFKYNFEYERVILTKLTELKKNRQAAREQRYSRKLNRELRKCQEVAEQQKKLGAVSYPSPDDLCIPTIEDLSLNNASTSGILTSGSQLIKQPDSSDFHNILQPIVLPIVSKSAEHRIRDHINGITTSETNHSSMPAINLTDFEDDTSSPFDNMELKTINDLDVLAQVLHNTQLVHTHPNITTTNPILSTEDKDSVNDSNVILEISKSNNVDENQYKKTSVINANVVSKNIHDINDWSEDISTCTISKLPEFSNQNIKHLNPVNDNR